MEEDLQKLLQGLQALTGGDGPNLEEHWFDTPYTITAE